MASAYYYTTTSDWGFTTIDPLTFTAERHVGLPGTVCETSQGLGEKLLEFLGADPELMNRFKDLYQKSPVWATPEEGISRVIAELTTMPEELLVIHACSRGGYIVIVVRA